MATRNYQILDVGLVVEARPGPFLEAFHKDYSRFEVSGPPSGPGLAVRFEDGHHGHGIFLEVDGLRENLDDHPLPALFATQLLARTLLERVTAYTILHAAVLGSDRGALALSGPSGAGKTTLTLALLQAGWSYYSDDFGPIHRGTGQIHPFPRSLWVRPAPGQEDLAEKRGKVPIPADEQGFRVGGPPLPLRWLFCLGAATGRGLSGGNSFRLNLRKGLGGPLLEELRGLEGLTLQPEDPADPLRWTGRFPREVALTRPIKDILHRHRGAIWEVFSLPEALPDFSQVPVLAEIPVHEAAYFLLQELRQDLAEDRRPGSLRPGALLSHLVDLLAGVACYRLTPGPLDHRLALIQAALNPVEAT